jgi:predicted GH43/DUF377 family glycosyl hydrolase
MATVKGIRRLKTILKPDCTRVLYKPFTSSNEAKVKSILDRVLTINPEEAEKCFEDVLDKFEKRHLSLKSFFQEQFDAISRFLPKDIILTQTQKLLIGSYFSHEYSLEAAALFNPSIVPHPDQSHLSEGELRFILSLRATGEGHISSIEFRSGILDAHGELTLAEPEQYVVLPRQKSTLLYNKEILSKKMDGIGIDKSFSDPVFARLPDAFTFQKLTDAIYQQLEAINCSHIKDSADARGMVHLTSSNYEVDFPETSKLSERVLFPTSPAESNGMEDARFVLFTDENGNKKYYASYTAYDGRKILPQLLETEDFLHFKMMTLSGSVAENKGMALFPRKINGQYAMISRQDGETVSIMFSDHLDFWHSSQPLITPKYPWEFLLMGNCGSPIETPEGWLLILHSAGPMRRYIISAALLDLKDPRKVIKRLPFPLIEPNESERKGYVPNVVYSCGSMLHGDKLIIPYAMSDYKTTFFQVPLKEVLSAMV